MKKPSRETFSQCPDTLDACRSLTSNEKRVITRILRFQLKGKCFASNETLANMLGLSVSGVAYILDSLKKTKSWFIVDTKRIKPPDRNWINKRFIIIDETLMHQYLDAEVELLFPNETLIEEEELEYQEEMIPVEDSENKPKELTIVAYTQKTAFNELEKHFVTLLDAFDYDKSAHDLAIELRLAILQADYSDSDKSDLTDWITTFRKHRIDPTLQELEVIYS